MVFEGNLHQISSRPEGSLRGRIGFVRQLSESVIVLALAVMSFRLFMAEGYMISTGSMAPCLLGYHRHVECPACHFQFAAGMAVPDEEGSDSVRAQDLFADDLAPVQSCVCPICGFEDIPTASLPRNEGDQLMVQKHTYQFRDPRRWEVIVFQHPADPHQAYVKRVVGLPGEAISLVDGDVWVDGRPLPRSLGSLRGMRIPVDDSDREPAPDVLAGWQSRWIPDEASRGWKRRDGEWTWDGKAGPSDSDRRDWLVFRHWIAAGGHHVTTAPLEKWPMGIGPPPASGQKLSFDTEARAISCVGVLSEEDAARWTSRTRDPGFRSAIAELAAASHEAPMTDDYGYNRPVEASSSFVVRDLMIECDIDSARDEGVLSAELDDGRIPYRVEFDLSEGRATLFEDGNRDPVAERALPAALGDGSWHLEMSLMDRHLLVALNGSTFFGPLMSEAEGDERPAPRRPARIGVADGAFRISSLRVYRDIYYTPKSEDRSPWRLADDEFFVLGDNSPVSIDSRCWDDPAVRRETLIGRPFAVHLPSRQASLTLWGRTHFVRIPDFSRVRYIH